MAAPVDKSKVVFYSPEPELIQAVQDDQEKLVHFFLQNKADPNTKSNDGDPAIVIAATRKLSIIEMLLDAKGNINAQTEAGATALHDAAICSNLVMLNFLLTRGANVLVKDCSGATCLMPVEDFQPVVPIKFSPKEQDTSLSCFADDEASSNRI